MRTLFNVILVSMSMLMWPIWLTAQTAGPGAPTLVFYNGKVVSMDNAGFTPTPGTISEAIAVRNNEILALGSNADIRTLVGPQTKQIDLKGRMIMPSFILTHGHPTDRAWESGFTSLQHVMRDGNEYIIVRLLKGTPEEQIASFETVLKEAVSVAKPGQWIIVGSDWGGNYEHMARLITEFWKHISVERLDQLAPNNPVRIKNSTIDGMLNTRGEEEVKKVFPDYTARGNRGPTGRMLEPDVILHNKVNLNADLLEAEMQIWTSHGITAFGSAPYTLNNLAALSLLDREGRLNIRYGWSYTGPNLDFTSVKFASSLLGSGSDYLWNIGAQGEWSGGDCTTIPAAENVKKHESCALGHGDPGREEKEFIVRTGGRIAAMHSGGDKDIDNLMDIIEEQSKAAGMSLEDIRNRRHSFDHSSGAPRPDQIPRIKRLGMMASMLNTMLWENNRSYDASYRVKNYGEEYAGWIVPRNSLTKAEVMNSQEIDRPLPQFVFYNVWVGITRMNEACGRAFGEEEATDLVTQLKALTIWGAHYLLRENHIGSLEPGKLADFVVLDQDLFSVPVNDIPKTKVLMTLLGGKVVHLVPGLAGEIGMEPAGLSTWPSKPLENRFVFRGPPKVCPAFKPDGFPGRVPG